MKELEVIKKEYIENYMISNNYPRKEEKEYYKITDDILNLRKIKYWER